MNVYNPIVIIKNHRKNETHYTGRLVSKSNLQPSPSTDPSPKGDDKCDKYVTKPNNVINLATSNIRTLKSDEKLILRTRRSV